MAALALLLAPAELDTKAILAFAAVHDLPEIQIGDLTPYDGVPPDAKRSLEERAMSDVAAALGPLGDALAELHAAYFRQDTPEARFVRELDRLDMALQALWYHRRGAPGAREFVESAGAVIAHPALVPILEAIRRDWMPRSAE
jgi:putative hydrolase of HD superfamily